MGIGVERHGHVGLVELREPPHNFFSVEMIRGVADAYAELDADIDVRCIVLAAEGRSFCAGANFGEGGVGSTEELYAAAARLCEVELPVVAAVQGPAIGGGFGLALTANLRVTCPEARFSANFVKLGIHHGFGVGATLPELLGPSKASLVLLTGRRFKGEEATEIGLADLCVPADELRDRTMELAGEIAAGAPLAIRAINRTLRAGLADRIREATAHEAAEQARLTQTDDAREGIRAVTERRDGEFTGR